MIASYLGITPVHLSRLKGLIPKYKHLLSFCFSSENLILPNEIYYNSIRLMGLLMKICPMKNLITLAIVLGIFMLSGCKNDLEISDFNISDNPPAFPSTEWEKMSSPESFNWSSSKLKHVEDFAKSIKHMPMIIDNGKLIAAYGDAHKNTM